VRESLTYADLGKRLGLSPQGAKLAYERGRLMCIPEQEVEEAKALHLEKLDYWESLVVEIFLADHVLVNFGKVVYGPDGCPMYDLQPKLAAMDRLLRIGKERREVLGYTAPSKRVLEIITEDALERAIANFNAQASELERETHARAVLAESGFDESRYALPAGRPS
jgi:hypothetical protein